VSISRLLTGHGEVHQPGWVDEVVMLMEVLSPAGSRGERVRRFRPAHVEEHIAMYIRPMER
jgi:hypothetical protein